MGNFRITPIENEGKRVLTTAQLAESYGTDSKVISYNFNHNRERYTEGKHYYCLTGEEKREFCNRLEIHDGVKATVFYLWTEKGALLHAKSLNTDKAWEVYDFLVENYFRKREEKQLSQAEIIAAMANNAVALEKRVAEQEKAIAGTNQRIDEMCEIMKPVSDDWRPAMNKLVNRIAYTAELITRRSLVQIQPPQPMKKQAFS
ncbi:MAG: ORF6N domain-containing protein [Ruminococcus flavefaciens]|nr:ORF6N domain-containing protein [Ruminococcus flavefaciens]